MAESVRPDYDGGMTLRSSATYRPFSGPTGRRVSAHRDELRSVLERHSVKNPRLFGSVARGDDREGSDVDILVDVPRGTSLMALARIQSELEEVLGVGVDIVLDAGLKPLIRARVETELIPL